MCILLRQCFPCVYAKCYSSPDVHPRVFSLPPPHLFNLDIMSLTDAKDAETLSMLESGSASSEERKTALSERQPSLRERQAALQDGNLNAEEFKDNILTRQSEADDSSELELKNTGSAKHYPQKRSAGTVIVDRCCNYGCYRKELARYCWDEAHVYFV